MLKIVAILFQTNFKIIKDFLIILCIHSFFIYITDLIKILKEC
jgi:hypothetical protein